MRMMKRRPHPIGIDIGQKVDPTAIAVVEQEPRQVDGKHAIFHVVRALERLPLGTPYPKVAEHLALLVAGVVKRAGAYPGIFADATGVGLPVVDLLTAGGTRVLPVYFTHGDRRIEQLDGSVSLGKAWLVSRLKSLLQTGQILLPQTSEAVVLAKELQDYEIRVDENANDKYGAFLVGTHDDLVTALGLGVQMTFRPFSGAVGPTPRLAVNPSTDSQFLDDLPNRGYRPYG